MSEVTLNSDLVELGVDEYGKSASKPKSKKKAKKKDEE